MIEKKKEIPWTVYEDYLYLYEIFSESVIIMCVISSNASLLLFPVMQYWEISSKTCRHLPPEEQEVYDAVKQTMSVKVTSSSSSSIVVVC